MVGQQAAVQDVGVGQQNASADQRPGAGARRAACRRSARRRAGRRCSRPAARSARSWSPIKRLGRVEIQAHVRRRGQRALEGRQREGQRFAARGRDWPARRSGRRAAPRRWRPGGRRAARTPEPTSARPSAAGSRGRKHPERSAAWAGNARSWTSTLRRLRRRAPRASRATADERRQRTPGGIRKGTSSMTSTLDSPALGEAGPVHAEAPRGEHRRTDLPLGSTPQSRAPVPTAETPNSVPSHGEALARRDPAHRPTRQRKRHDPEGTLRGVPCRHSFSIKRSGRHQAADAPAWAQRAARRLPRRRHPSPGVPAGHGHGSSAGAGRSPGRRLLPARRTSTARKRPSAS